MPAGLLLDCGEGLLCREDRGPAVCARLLLLGRQVQRGSECFGLLRVHQLQRRPLHVRKMPMRGLPVLRLSCRESQPFNINYLAGGECRGVAVCELRLTSRWQTSSTSKGTTVI